MLKHNAVVAVPKGAEWAMAALFLGAIGIAFAPIFVRLSELAPTATAFWRIALALPVLWLWVGTQQTRRREPAATVRWRDRAAMLGAGLFFAGDLAAWHWSIAYTSVANATLLANFAPIFVALAGWLLFGHRFTARFLGGLALAITGAVVLMGDSLALSWDHFQGDALGLLTAVFYGAYILSVSRLRARFPTATVMAWSAVGTAAGLLPVTLWFGEGLVPVTAAGWAVLAGLAWMSHAGGQSLIAFALAHLPAAFSSVSLLLQPAIAAMLAWALLNEPLGIAQAAGAAVILAGIVLARLGSAGR